MLNLQRLLTDEEIGLLNKLGHSELTASHTYLHLSICMKNKGFFGAEKFYMNESNDERTHYLKISDFMNDMGEELKVLGLEPVDTEAESLMDSFEMAYNMEADLLKAYEDAYAVVSAKTKIFIQEMIDIQVKAVGEYGDLIARLSLTEEPILIDQELGE
jgi:ferritin